MKYGTMLAMTPVAGKPVSMIEATMSQSVRVRTASRSVQLSSSATVRDRSRADIRAAPGRSPSGNCPWSSGLRRTMSHTSGARMKISMTPRTPHPARHEVCSMRMANTGTMRKPNAARPPLDQANAAARRRTNQLAMAVRGPTISSPVRAAPTPTPSSA